MLGGDFWCTPPLYFWYFSAQNPKYRAKGNFESTLSFNEFLAKTYERNIFLQKFGRVSSV